MAAPDDRVERVPAVDRMNDFPMYKGGVMRDAVVPIEENGDRQPIARFG
jgi:hypothetical protein